MFETPFPPPRLAKAALLLAVALLASAAFAEQGLIPGAPSPAPVASPSPVAFDPEAPFVSPRASMAEFLALTKRGKYAEAASFLELGPGQVGEGPELARRLRAVLDRRLGVELESLSPLATGDVEDGQATGSDLLGSIRTASDRREPVRIVRRDVAGAPRWVFSRGTVARIDAWFDALGDAWVRRYLPEWLQRMGPFRLLRWQALAIVLILFLAYGVAHVVAWPARRIAASLVRQTSATWDDGAFTRLRGLWALTCMLAVMEGLLPLLELSASAQAGMNRFMRTWGLLILFLALLRAVDLIGERLKSASFSLGNPSARSALSIATRTAKVAVVLIGILAALLELGYPVASVLAGLGIGGIGLALAAQKTVENLFGSVSLAADEAIRIGDTVRVDNMVGQVEGIGLRSTRLRTLDRTVVTIPNGLLAGQRIESLTARDRMRLGCRLGLVQSTTADQVRQVLAGCERVLRAHDKVWPHDLSVRFVELAASSLELEVNAWFVASWDEFTLIRQDMLLAFLEVVEQAGTRLAYPTTTVVVEENASRAVPQGTR